MSLNLCNVMQSSANDSSRDLISRRTSSFVAFVIPDEDENGLLEKCVTATTVPKFNKSAE